MPVLVKTNEWFCPWMDRNPCRSTLNPKVEGGLSYFDHARIERRLIWLREIMDIV